ncbi:MAG: beta-propeller fold lactonase family protein [Cyanobacteria bacterium J06573_2]
MMLWKSKWFKRISLGIFGFVVALIIYGLLQLIEPIKVAPITNSSVQFNGRALLIASDADMVATAYADAKLDRVAGIEDTLTAIDLPLNQKRPQVNTLQVSNSVMSWPQIIATSPDGTKAYIVEVRSRPADGIQEFDSIDEMPEGRKLTVVDISNPTKPQMIESVDVGRNPEHISISPDGRFLAVNIGEQERELLIIQLQSDGTLGKRFYFSIPGTGIDTDNQTVAWHPSGDYLAISQNGSQVRFYQVETDANNEVTVKPYTEAIEVGNHLSHGRFSGDGRFFLVTDLKWSTWGNFRQGNFLMNPKGEMIAIRFEPSKGNSPEIVSRAEVGLSPEGFALNPDNSLIATVNMRRTYFSPNFPPVWRGKPYSSLSLVQFDKNSGKLNTLEEYGFEGLLPEQATFDADGKSLAVVIYNYAEQSPKTGAVEFWNVVGGNKPRLERTGFKIDVVRGAHDITLVR